MTSPTTPSRQLHLGLMFWATGTHSAGWRHPDARSDGAYDIGFIQEIAQQAEAAKFDFIFLGDRLVADPALARTNPGQMSRLEPFTIAAAIAAVTTRIGLVVTTNTTYSDPYTVARMMSSLDHISRGRSSWNIVTGADPAAALNFSRTEHWSNDKRYDWADEFADAVVQLWDGSPASSNESPATTTYQGQYIHIDGSLNLPRPPQGRPILLHAGTSDRSRELGARLADVLFTGEAVLSESQAYYADVKSRAVRHGRDPDDVKIIPGLVVIVAPTTAQAVDILDTLNRLIILDPEDAPESTVGHDDAVKPHFQYVGMGRGAKRNLTLASEAIGVDVRGHAHDDVVPATVLEHASPAGRAIFAYISRLTRRTVDAADPAQRITYLDLIHGSIAQTSAVVGNPVEVADYIEHWFHSRAADGFNIFPSYLPGSIEQFVELVVPELQRRGLYRTDYAGTMLREHFGIKPPQAAKATVGSASVVRTDARVAEPADCPPR